MLCNPYGNGMSAVDFIVYFKKSERKLNPTVNGLIGHASGKYFIIRKGVVHYCVTTPFFRRRDKIRTCDLCVPNALWADGHLGVMVEIQGYALGIHAIVLGLCERPIFRCS